MATSWIQVKWSEVMSRFDLRLFIAKAGWRLTISVSIECVNNYYISVVYHIILNAFNHITPRHRSPTKYPFKYFARLANWINWTVRLTKLENWTSQYEWVPAFYVSSRGQGRSQVKIIISWVRFGAFCFLADELLVEVTVSRRWLRGSERRRMNCLHLVLRSIFRSDFIKSECVIISHPNINLYGVSSVVEWTGLRQ